MKKGLLSILLLGCMQTMMAQPESMNLSGTWRFQTDPMGFGKTPGSELYLAKLSENIMLPGTMDEGGKGMPTTARYVDRLTRKFEYCGQAWYQREIVIPESWKDKEIILTLERCHWETAVYLDGWHMGTEEHLSTPNRFNLTNSAKPGIHTLTICVDNRLKYPMDQWNHGTTEYTQTNWNGIVGDIKLDAYDKTNIQRIQAYPNLENKSVKMTMTLANHTGVAATGELTLALYEKDGKKVLEQTKEVDLGLPEQEINEEVVIGKHVKEWNEFHPDLYTMKATLKLNDMIDEKEVTFGMREVSQGKHHVRINNRDVHLRGALDCCVFPLTGYPSTDAKDWKRIFSTVQDYGMNHIRFHSWCPPEAAFIAADELGIYLQVELPMWIKDVGQYPARRDFFEKEMYSILEEYGNHPSFILMCNGNENEGNFDVLEDLVKKGQKHDSRHLYSASTARTHTASDQFYTSHVSPKGGITVYEGIPSTDWDKNETSDIDCPVIAHETGQRCMYPNFKEMEKYTGVLTPRNFEVFRERLARNGMLHQADDFFRATGAHTVLQYKEVNESLLRTEKNGGFQLLGLGDFPGQGSSFVGILDAFWESKGLVTPEKYRESCGNTVLLARMPKRAYTSDETYEVEMDIYHFGENPIKRNKLRWSLETAEGEVVAKGKIATPTIECASVDSLGMVSVDLSSVKEASQLTLHAYLEDYHNEWNIWVYPETTEEVDMSNVVYAETYDENVKEALAAGKNVLLVTVDNPGRKTHFASHFWNPIMFRWNPMIVGTLIQENHPAFKHFPTSYYADWQWWDILNYGKAIEMTELTLTPVIQSIDTYEFNEKLGLAFEARVGKGKLFLLSVDGKKDIERRPAMRQLVYSIKKYVTSSEFNPTDEVLPYQLDAIMNTQKVQKPVNANNAAIQQLLNK